MTFTIAIKNSDICVWNEKSEKPNFASGLDYPLPHLQN